MQLDNLTPDPITQFLPTTDLLTEVRPDISVLSPTKQSPPTCNRQHELTMTRIHMLKE